ncbi:unnamed protein product, partial [Cylicostephanus goldi]
MTFDCSRVKLPLQKRNELRTPPPLPPRNSPYRPPLEASLSLRPTVPKEVDRTSSDTPVSTVRDIISRNGRQGHKKTNSLDRGLTLAKSMKAGPFPPPANKSNSLTRQEPDDDEEECARNTAAEGVILQITTKVIGDHSITCANGELEPIASESSSLSSPNSEVATKILESKQEATMHCEDKQEATMHCEDNVGNGQVNAGDVEPEKSSDIYIPSTSALQ